MMAKPLDGSHSVVGQEIGVSITPTSTFLSGCRPASNRDALHTVLVRLPPNVIQARKKVSDCLVLR